MLIGLMVPAAAGELHLRGHGGPVRAIALSADGTRAITGSFDYSVMTWLVGTDAVARDARLIGHDAAVNAVALVPGERAISGSDDGTVAIWDLKSSKLVARLEGHKGKVVSLAVAPDGRQAASAGWDRTARLWDLQNASAGPVLSGHAGKVSAVVFSEDGRTLFTASTDGKIRSWNSKTGEQLRTLHDHGWGINALRLVPGGRQLLFGGLNGDVRIVDVETGEAVKTLATHERPVLTLEVSRRHGLAVSGSANGKIHIWSLKDWRLVRAHDNPFGPVWALAVARDGRGLFFAGLDDHVIYWQVQPPKPFDAVESEMPRRLKNGAHMEPGQRYFLRKCSICHTLDPDDGNKAGPTLYGVFGRKVGTLKGYVYSEALRKADFIWTEKTIGDLFDHGPQHLLPGTKMPLQQMTNVDERNALIAYLKKATAKKAKPATGDGND